MNRKKGVVLIVDDKQSNIYALKSLLDDDDKIIITANTGNDALKVALEQEVDLIVLDVQMPDFNGFEVANILKSNKRTKDIPIIFASAERKEQRFLKQGYEEGAIDYLFKPLDPHITKAKVNVLLKLHLQKKELIEKNKSLEKSALLINNSTDAIGVIDVSTGRIEEVNTALTRILGYEREDIIGKPLLSFLSEHDRELISDLFSDQRETITFETRLENSDGSIRLLHWKVISKEGKWFFDAWDITEVKEVDRLRDFLAAVVKQSHDAIYLHNKEGKVISWNEGAKEIYGYSEEEALKLDIWDLTPFHLHEQVSERINHIFSGKVYTGSESQRITKSGKVLNVMLSASLVTDATTGEKTIAVIERDITQQKINHEKIKESEVRFRNLFQMTPSPMWVYDLESLNFLEVNLAAENEYGYTREEFLAMKITDIRPYEDHHKLRHRRKNSSEEFEQIHGLRHRLKDGKVIDVEVTSHLFEYGGRKAALVIAKNITESLKAAEELKNAKQKAERLLVAQEAFIANVSHEIRTPMNAIIGFTSLLERTQLTDIQNEYIGYIKKSADTLLNIINDILELSKIDSGIIAFEKIPFSLSSQLNTLKSMLETKAKEKGIGFKLLLADNLPPNVIGDPTRLSQILLNLIHNAIKFTESGGIVVSVYTEKIIGKSAEIRFTVADTGIGIPASKLDKIFDRFIQSNSDTTRKYGGTGLGLNIVRNLIKLQNGTINVTSKEGEGTVFTVVLPYEFTNEYTQPDKKNYIEVVDSLNKEMCILLVEDNLINQKLAVAVLNDVGLDVDIAENGIQAVNMLKNYMFDIVLMDLQMPEMDGYAATKKIRQEVSSQIPIIAMTANALPGEKEKCLAYGMNDYISKPFNRNELLEKLVRYQPSFVDPLPKDSPLLDLEYLRGVSVSGDQFVKSILETFLSDMPLVLERLQIAVAKSALQEVAREAHTLKSGFSFLGAKQPFMILADIEERSQNGDSKYEYSIAISRVEMYFKKLYSEVKEKLRQL